MVLKRRFCLVDSVRQFLTWFKFGYVLGSNLNSLTGLWVTTSTSIALRYGEGSKAY